MAKIFVQILAAVPVAHLASHNIVHGDLKLDRFFVDKDGSLKLGYFGCSWCTKGGDGSLMRLVARASRRATLSAKNQLLRSITRQMATINVSVLLHAPPHMGGRGRGRP